MLLLARLDSAKSISRYTPPNGTAGFARSAVSGARRVPAPPASTIPRIDGSGMVSLPRALLPPGSLPRQPLLLPAQCHRVIDTLYVYLVPEGEHDQYPDLPPGHLGPPGPEEPQE